MYLVRLVYASTVTNGLTQAGIENILQVARNNNSKHGITGLLCFNNKYFLQCLEGPRRIINETYEKIINDDRHKELVILDYNEIACRDFTDWAMGYVPMSQIHNTLSLKYARSNEFSPYEISGESALKMLIEIKQTIPTQ